MTINVFQSVAVFIVGCTIGSFLNVCIYRIPEGISIVSPPSRCPSCFAPIRWYQNVPVLGWLMLRGRCAACRAPISPRYPLVEALNGFLYLAVLSEFGPALSSLVYAFFVSTLVVVTFIDLDQQIIPNMISLPGIALGFCASFLVPSLSWSDSLLGIILGGGSLWLVAVIYLQLTGAEGMGMGDVKLLAMIGAFLGYKALLLVVLVSSFSGAVVGALLMVARGGDRRFAIPYGPFLSFAAVITLFWGVDITRWYFSFF